MISSGCIGLCAMIMCDVWRVVAWMALIHLCGTCSCVFLCEILVSSNFIWAILL